MKFGRVVYKEIIMISYLSNVQFFTFLIFQTSLSGFLPPVFLFIAPSNSNLIKIKYLTNVKILFFSDGALQKISSLYDLPNTSFEYSLFFFKFKICRKSNFKTFFAIETLINFILKTQNLRKRFSFFLNYPRIASMAKDYLIWTNYYLIWEFLNI